MTTLSWVAIFMCLSQSAMLSGLNLGLFSLSKLELKVEAQKGNVRAQQILALREDANFALVTILWGNVGVNVILTLISGSVLNGVLAFLFSTVVITTFAEILPQAYFSRYALQVTALLAPVLRLYQFILYPVARPTAWMLDKLLGGEEMRYFRERDLRHMLQLHMEAASSDISRVEGQGALNFLDLDDVPLDQEGEAVVLDSIIALEFEGERAIFPDIQPTPDNPFLRRINRSGEDWIIIVDTQANPRLVIDADDFMREALFDPNHFNPYRHCHKPIILRDGKQKLGEILQHFRIGPADLGADVLEYDVILLWNEQPRVLTGADVLGRLLRGIARLPTSARYGGRF